jgi:ABC-type phosphate transport system substrate-binding protein
MLCSLFISTVHADVVVIVNPNNAINALTEVQVRELFLGEKKMFNGGMLLPLDQTIGEAARTHFYTEVIKKSEAELKSFWSRLIFTGKGQAPLVIGSDNDILNIIAHNPNLVGYIDDTHLSDKVKVVYRHP